MLNANNNANALNVVITAASSALGRETMRQFVAHGHRVTGLTGGSDGAAKVRQDGGLPAYVDLFRAGEIRSVLRMAGADALVHLAAQTANGFPHRATPWAEANRLLRDGAGALLDAVADSGVKFMVYAGCAFVYGDQRGQWVDENAALRETPATSAAIQAEEGLLSHPVPACVLRAGTVYGPDEAGTKALAEAIQRGRSLFLGDAHGYHNWTHLTDLARAVVLAAEQQPADQIFNIVDDTPASANDFAGYMAAGLGQSAPVGLRVPAFAAFTQRFVMSEMQPALLNASARVKNDKAKQMLGWSPRYPNFRSGLDQTLMVWRSGA